MPNYNGFIPSSTIYLVYDNVDFRMSVNGLTAYIQEVMGINPMAKACFMFCNKQLNKIKIIEWDFNGFWMYYKRLESGKFKWPHSTESYTTISRDQYDWLMNGLSINQRDGFKEVISTKVI